MKQVKVFTIDEVNRLLPEIRLLIENLRQIRDRILAQEAEVDALEIISEDKTDAPAITDAMKAYQESVNLFYDHIDRMTESGYHLKDLDMGLIDFYAAYDQRLIYLCWKWDEEKITHWHELDSGFSGRKPISGHPHQDETRR